MLALRPTSLRTRLLLLPILSVLLPTAGLLINSAVNQRHLAATAARRDALRLVHAANLHQTEMVVATRQLLLSLARLPVVRQTRIHGPCSPVLADLLKIQPYYTNLGIAAINGKVLCSAVPLPRPVNVADRAYFRRALETRNFAIGNYQIGRITGKSMIVFGAPVFDNDGKAKLVVFAAVDLPRLNQLISEVPLPQDSTVTLVDSHGTVLAHLPDPQAWVGKSIAKSPLMRAMQAHKIEDTAELAGPDGITRFYGFTPLHISPTDDAYLAAGVPKAAAFAPINSTFISSMEIFTVLALLALTAAWIGGDVLIVRRVNAISRAAKRLAHGDMTARTGLPHGSDEFGQVARGFDDMAEKLERHQSEIDTANKELKQINRALMTLGSGNRALVRAVDEQSLLESMCRLIVETGGYRLAWVGYIEFDEYKSIRLAAQAGFDEGYLEALNLTWADTKRGRGPAGTAIRTGAPCIVRDILTDVRFDPWRDDAVRRGYASAIALPLNIRGRIVGVLCIYSSESDTFASAEVSLLEELANDLAFGIATLRTRTQSEQAHETVWRMAYYDAITGLPNHTRLAEFIQQILLDASPDSGPFALLLLDVDRFRDVNDALGIAQANSLLQEIGRRIRQMLPDTEMVARMRGDEFAILLPQSDAAHAIDTAQRILATMEEPFVMADLSLDVRVNIGVVFGPQHGDQADFLIRRADLAVRRAKQSDAGYAVYTAEQDDDSPRRLALAADLRQAIEGDQLLLYFQPKIDIKTGRICGVESLARWNHPQRGAVPPDEFIRLAEHTGLIRPLTYRVLEIAARQARAWLDIGLSIPIAVNLSARNLCDTRLLDKIKDLITTWGIESGQLELEITETAIMEDPAGALDILTRLSDMGIALSIDDFGTGYSSLSYLMKLPVDSIKIDKSFVIDMLSNNDSVVIVRSTIVLAHDLGLQVVAEGVESEAIWQHLTALGCDVAQGYHIGRPMPVADFEHWLRQSCSKHVWSGRG